LSSSLERSEGKEGASATIDFQTTHTKHLILAYFFRHFKDNILLTLVNRNKIVNGNGKGVGGKTARRQETTRYFAVLPSCPSPKFEIFIAENIEIG